MNNHLFIAPQFNSSFASFQNDELQLHKLVKHTVNKLEPHPGYAVQHPLRLWPRQPDDVWRPLSFHPDANC